jgi:hypothetical protein
MLLVMWQYKCGSLLIKEQKCAKKKLSIKDSFTISFEMNNRTI